MAWILAALGALQIGLIAATFSRIIDPGPPALDAIGTLAGLGAACGCAVAVTVARPRNATMFRSASVVAALAGIVYAGAWLSLLGGLFRLDDLPRIGVIVSCDLVVAGWFLAASWTLRRPRPRGFLSVGFFLSVRWAVEAWYLAGAVSPPSRMPGGPSSGLEVLLLGGLVLSGYVLIAFWELGLARWTLSGGGVVARF